MEVFKLFGSILIDNDKANQSISKTDKQAEKSGGNMSNSFKKIGLALTAAFSIAKIQEFGQECINAYKEQVEAETKLETIMKQRMKSTDASIQSVKDLTAAQQKLGVVDGDIQIAGAQQLSTFLTTDSALKKLIPAMNDLGVQQNGVNVTSGNMVSIGNLMGKVMQGQTGALKKVGVTFSEAEEKVLKFGNEQERASMLAKVITNNVGHMNEEIAKTDAGKQQIYKNTMEELQETIGQKLIPVQTLYYEVMANLSTLFLNNVIPFIENCVTSFNNFTNSISSNSGVSNFFVGLWQTYGIPIFNALISVVNTVYQSWMIIWPSLQNLLFSAFSYMNAIWNGIGKPIFDFIMMIVLQIFAIFNQYWPMIALVIKDAFDIIARLYNEILKPIVDAIAFCVQNYLLPIFTVVWGAISGVVRTCFQYISSIWNGTLKPVFNGIIDFVTGVFSGNWSKAWNGVKSIVSGVWNGIKTAIETPMRLASNVVSGIINAIKGFFNFNISWPKIPLPHFNVKPKGWGIGDLLKGQLPSLGIDWYAKAMDNGMILNKPTIFGAANGKMLGAGEAGSETVVGTQSLMDMISSASNSGNEALLNVLCEIRDYLSDDDRWYKVFLRALTDGSFAIELDGREVGRIVKKYA